MIPIRKHFKKLMKDQPKFIAPAQDIGNVHLSSNFNTYHCQWLIMTSKFVEKEMN